MWEKMNSEEGKSNFQSSRFERECDNGIRRRDGCSDFFRYKKSCCEDGEDAQGGIMVMVMRSRMRDWEGIMMMVMLMVLMMRKTTMMHKVYDLMREGEWKAVCKEFQGHSVSDRR